MGKQVKCKYCAHMNNNHCSAKDSKVKTGKRRTCDTFKIDPPTIVIRPKPASTYVPLWQLDNKVRKRLIKQMEAKQEAAAQAQAAAQTNTAPTPSYLEKAPTTSPDCLSGIRSSVGVDDDPDTGLHI